MISEWIERLTFNIITKKISGNRYFGNLNDGNGGEAQRIGILIKELSRVPAISDLVPFLGGLQYFLGQVKSIKWIGRELDTIVGSWVEEQTMSRAKSEQIDKPAFIDVMLSVIEDDGMFGHTRETIIKATVLVCLITFCYEKCYTHNIFTTNFRWQLVIGVHLSTPLILIFYLPFIVCHLEFFLKRLCHYLYSFIINHNNIINRTHILLKLRHQ